VTVGVFLVLLIVAFRLIGPNIITAGDPWGLSTTVVLGATVFTLVADRNASATYRSFFVAT
jgi:hypothetical protein